MENVLDAAVNAAREALALNNTLENREAYKAAWNARAATETPKKAWGYASRAGQRQAAIARAEQHERNARAANRRFGR